MSARNVDINFVAIRLAIVIVPMLLVLSLSLTLPVQIANAKGHNQKSDTTNHSTKQLNQQQTICKGKEVNCDPTAINIICVRGSVCHIGYDTPILMATPF